MTIFSCRFISIFSSFIFLLSRPKIFAISLTRFFSTLRSSKVFIFSSRSFWAILEYVSKSLLTLVNYSCSCLWFSSISLIFGIWYLCHFDNSSSSSLFLYFWLDIRESCLRLSCLSSMISCSFLIRALSMSSSFSVRDFSSVGPAMTFPLLICKDLYFYIKDS